MLEMVKTSLRRLGHLAPRRVDLGDGSLGAVVRSPDGLLVELIERPQPRCARLVKYLYLAERAQHFSGGNNT